MNERIKELVKQATTIEEHKWGVSYDNFDKEKFAELIVKECAKHALDFNHNIQSLQDKVMRGNLDRVQDYIKDRMGVQE
jgi:hypothetical protein